MCHAASNLPANPGGPLPASVGFWDDVRCQEHSTYSLGRGSTPKQGMRGGNTYMSPLLIMKKKIDGGSEGSSRPQSRTRAPSGGRGHVCGGPLPRSVGLRRGRSAGGGGAPKEGLVSLRDVGPSGAGTPRSMAETACDTPRPETPSGSGRRTPRSGVQRIGLDGGFADVQTLFNEFHFLEDFRGVASPSSSGAYDYDEASERFPTTDKRRNLKDVLQVFSPPVHDAPTPTAFTFGSTPY
mmetsp:Transcript_88118/g.247835  ORF Transcript_88118/g.247835 Transcript_88118/m.247835 type:complete len:239 (-) Transcript_88118:78-794(-)